MKRILLTLFMLYFPTFGYGKNIKINNRITGYKTTIIDQTDHDVTIRFELGSFSIDEKTLNNQKYTSIRLTGASYLSNKSYPELPKVLVPLAIPDTYQNEINVISAEHQLMNLGIPAPSKGDIERSVNPSSIPYTFADLYKKSANIIGKVLPFPTKAVNLSSPYRLRNIQGVNLTIYPFQYLAMQGLFKVTTKVDLKVSYKTASLKWLKSQCHMGLTNLFKTSFANWDYQQKLVKHQTQRANTPAGKILIVSGDQFLGDDLDNFAHWKRQLGYQVKVVKISNVGQNYEQLKSYIQSEYDLNPLLAYVILVGDAEHVPYYKGTAGNAKNNEADPMYGLVDGNDSYPDIIVGRISVKNMSDLRNILSKSINYEKNPSHGEWYRSALGIASDEGTPSDGDRADLLKDVLLASDEYDQVESLYDPDVKASHISEAINDGQSLINYIGHGYETAWVTGFFKNRHIESLNNGAKLPVIISVACVNGRFSYPSSDSFAEKWLKVGQQGSPKGAVAIFASSTNQSWVPPTIGQLEISRLVASDAVYTVGSLMMSGSIAVLQDGSYSAKQTFQTWHIFGDPSLEFRSDVPQAIDQSYLQHQLPWGHSYFVGEPGLRLSITNGKALIFTQKSDEDGFVSLPEERFFEKQNESLTLTISGKNKIPLIKKLNLSQGD